MPRPPASLLRAAAPLLAAASLCAQVKLVPSQYATITAALAAANGGDTILVAPGVYNERLTWPAIDGIRLIGQSGAAVTTIGGGAGGTVVTFGAGPTRQTVLAGFTITNGFLAGTSNFGAGIRIVGSSPTIRDNRVTGNACAGTSTNYGGAIHVGGGGANPLISHNEIDNNELRNGTWNYGAGIYVASSATTEILGNHIHDNRNLTTSSGHGYGGGIYCGGPCLIASNFIHANTNSTAGQNCGGAIATGSSGAAYVYNNTIVGNSVIGGLAARGGGVYADGNSVATLRGNVVAGNVGAGFHFAQGTLGFATSNYNDFWNNAPDYTGVVPGANDLSIDPLFVSATDLHLSAASPCIDAIPAVPSLTVSMDVDEDPRQVDGDLDGGTTDGARLDIGADEFTSVRLVVLGAPQIGTTVTWSVTVAQPSVYLLAVDLQVGNVLMEPFGTLLLGTTAVLRGIATPPAGFPTTIPNNPALRAITILGQALVLPLAVNAGQFTNRASITTW